MNKIHNEWTCDYCNRVENTTTAEHPNGWVRMGVGMHDDIMIRRFVSNGFRGERYYGGDFCSADCASNHFTRRVKSI